MPLRILPAALLLVVLASTGCSTTADAPQEPGPAPSPATPDPVPTEEPMAAGEAEVIEVYRTFTTAYDTVLQTGNGDMSLVSPYLRGPARTAAVEFIGAAADNGIVQEGAVTVESVTVESYDDAPGGEARLRSCIDASTYAFTKDGGAVGEPGGKGVSYVTLREQDGSWMIDSMDPRPDEEC